MLTNKIKILSCLLLFILFLVKAEPLYSKDIKNEVIKESNIDEQIQVFCSEYCQGNSRKGYLKSLTVNQIDSNKYNVVSRVALQSRHVYKDVVIYDHTVLINTFGTLNSENCELQVKDIFVQNDFKNIFTNLIEDQTDIIGRKEIIEDCQKFLDE